VEQKRRRLTILIIFVVNHACARYAGLDRVEGIASAANMGGAVVIMVIILIVCKEP
jgi:hypothetical protein